MEALGAELGSMLRLARFRGAGSFNPRKDGPLMTGCGSGTEAAARVAVVFCDAGTAGEGIAAAGTAGIWAVLFGDATGAGAGSKVAPHMPQKRFVSGFSLPQRGQRTNPPRTYCIAYDIL